MPQGHALAEPGRGAGPSDGQCHCPAGQGRRDSCRCRGAGGHNAAVSTLKDQTPRGLCRRCRRQDCGGGVRRRAGAVVGPIQSDFGWVVAKVDSVKAVGGKTLDQARTEIATKLNADKRKGAIEDMVDKVQNSVDGGSNFAEAAAAAKLPVTTTPLITAERHLARRPVVQAAAGTGARAQGRLRDRAQRPARDRHSAGRCGLCAGFPGAGRARRTRAARLHP